ncbi:MAG TPA: hypothetical protein VGE21_02280 [Flavobacteriales bacterium]
MYAYQPSEGLLLGTALAAWSNALDPTNADVQWFLRKWEAHLTLDDGTVSVRHIHALFMRLRRELAARISTDLVEHMDLLIESEVWQQRALARWQLCTGYFAEREHRKTTEGSARRARTHASVVSAA